MVKLIEFFQGGDTEAEKLTNTQLQLRHSNKYVELFCPDTYSSATFDIRTFHKYSTLAWLSGLSGPGGTLPDHMRQYFDLEKDTVESVTIKAGEPSKEYKIVEGKIQGKAGSLYEAWHDMDIDITLTQVLDKDSKDVTPSPDPVVQTSWDDFKKWFKDNQWTFIGLALVGVAGLALLAFLVMKARPVATAAPVQPVQPVVVAVTK
jgi:hypothetical protein